MALKSLTKREQGDYSYVLGPYRKPVLFANPQDRIIVETEDAFESKIQTEDDRPEDVLIVPFLNPQSGPIHIHGAEKGDTLAVTIHSIQPLSSEGLTGTTCLIPEFGGLTGTDLTATLQEPLPQIVKKVKIDNDFVYWNSSIKIPYEPFIGTIGTSPEVEAINSLTPSKHGGNMDLPLLKANTVLYLPVKVTGALLYLGDVHACQGDGELCGVAIEHRAKVEISVDIIKNKEITWPRLETENYITAIGSTRPMEDAARIAYRELIYWMKEDYSFNSLEAYMLLTQVGRVKLGNMVDPNYTIGASISKEYLPK